VKVSIITEICALKPLTYIAVSSSYYLSYGTIKDNEWNCRNNYISTFACVIKSVREQENEFAKCLSLDSLANAVRQVMTLIPNWYGDFL